MAPTRCGGCGSDFSASIFAAIMSLLVLLPRRSTSTGGWRCWLFALCVVFTVLTTLVVRKTYGMQSESRRITAISPHALRTRSAMWRWCRASLRIDAEVQGLRSSPTSSGGADAGAVVVGGGHRHHQGVDHDHRAGDLYLGIALHAQGLTSVGEIVMFVSFANHADPEARTGGQLHQQRVHGGGRGCRNSSTCWMPCRVRDRPDAIDTATLGPGRIQGRFVFI